MLYVHTIIRPMKGRAPFVDPDPSAISGTSRRSSPFCRVVCPPEDAAGTNFRKPHLVLTPNTDMIFWFVVAVRVLHLVPLGKVVYYCQLARNSVARTRHREVRARHTPTETACFCATLLDALNELTRLDSRNMPFHIWHNRAAGRFRWRVVP
jgi:hypothetical protein